MENSCFICGRDGRSVHLERHHLIEGRGRRQLSEKYGLVVYLCPDCHRNGPHAAHRDAVTAKRLHQYAQRLWMEQTGGTVEDFVKIFGKNYLGDGVDAAVRERIETVKTLLSVIASAMPKGDVSNLVNQAIKNRIGEGPLWFMAAYELGMIDADEAELLKVLRKLEEL